MPPPSQSKPSPEVAEARFLRRVDVRAVLIVAAVFNAIVGLVFALAGYMVIAVAAQRGVLDQVNSVTADLGNSHPAHVGALQLAFLWTLIVVGWTVVATALVALGVVIFNHVLRLVGGVELDLHSTRGERPAMGPRTRQLLAAVNDWLQSIAPPSADPGGTGR